MYIYVYFFFFFRNKTEHNLKSYFDTIAASITTDDQLGKV